MSLPRDLKSFPDKSGETWSNKESDMETKPKIDLQIVVDAARWQFILAAAANPTGPERLAYAACQTSADPALPNAVQMQEVVDKARALLAAVDEKQAPK